jgi:type VI secretion system protein ImpB
MSASQQSKLTRVRRPRVHITYDVETNGAMQQLELPFVVGVMADLTGQPKEPLRPLKERKFVAIDRDNLDSVMARSGTRVAIRVPNRLTDKPDTQLAVELNFKSMEDFEPARIAEQIGPMRDLLALRRKLTELMSRMEGNDKLEQLLADIINDAEKAKAMADALTGTESPAQE